MDTALHMSMMNYVDELARLDHNPIKGRGPQLARGESTPLVRGLGDTGFVGVAWS